MGLFWILICTGVLCLTVIVCWYEFSGMSYKRDEKIVHHRSWDARAKFIEQQRKTGRYNTYVPIEQRSDYNKRYPEHPIKTGKEEEK